MSKKVSDALREQINRLTAGNYRWLHDEPSGPGTACAVYYWPLGDATACESITAGCSDHLDQYTEGALDDLHPGWRNEYESIVDWNDHSDCTVEQVVAVLQRAEQLALLSEGHPASAL